MIFHEPYEQEIRQSDQRYKYACAMSDYLYSQEADEWNGSCDELGYAFHRFGKRILFVNDQGFVWVEKYASVEEAKAEYAIHEGIYSDWLEHSELEFV